ncbi:MAG: class I SAM-dependent methyltransferase [Opitutaceae bacterium]|nr:class I SAM-dependent methyltransferase [Opitutaceae bacterium]
MVFYLLHLFYLANQVLRLGNAKVDSLTTEKAETARLAALEKSGHFAWPIFPVLPAFECCDPAAIFSTIDRCAPRFAQFAAVPARGDAFSLDNYYYTTPDAEVLYAIVQNHRPRLVVEVGSGHSTLLFRQAITDAGSATKLVSIDPEPRRAVAQHADVCVREQVEKTKSLEWFAQLQANDILFIDSSHEIKAGNDVLFLLLKVLPTLAPGVLVHIHDIFLPYEYPRDWLVKKRWDWSEQYLVQALLQDSAHFEVLWAGHYLQRTRADFIQHFPQWRSWDARSLWLRRKPALGKY